MKKCKAPQRRNPKTNRCKKPCRKDQATNPKTNRCVSRSYLASLRAKKKTPRRRNVSEFDFDFSDSEFEFSDYGFAGGLDFSGLNVDFNNDESSESDEDFKSPTKPGPLPKQRKTPIQDAMKKEPLDEQDPRPLDAQRPNHDPILHGYDIFDEARGADPKVLIQNFLNNPDDSNPPKPLQNVSNEEDAQLLDHNEFDRARNEDPRNLIGNLANTLEPQLPPHLREEDALRFPMVSEETIGIFKGLSETLHKAKMEARGVLALQEEYPRCNLDPDSVQLLDSNGECGMLYTKVVNSHSFDPEYARIVSVDRSTKIMWEVHTQDNLRWWNVASVVHQLQETNVDVVFLFPTVYWRIVGQWARVSVSVEPIIERVAVAMNGMAQDEGMATWLNHFFGDWIHFEMLNYDSTPAQTHLKTIPEESFDYLENSFRIATISSAVQAGLRNFSTHAGNPYLFAQEMIMDVAINAVEQAARAFGEDYSRVRGQMYVTFDALSLVLKTLEDSYVTHPIVLETLMYLVSSPSEEGNKFAWNAFQKLDESVSSFEDVLRHILSENDKNDTPPHLILADVNQDIISQYKESADYRRIAERLEKSAENRDEHVRLGRRSEDDFVENVVYRCFLQCLDPVVQRHTNHALDYNDYNEKLTRAFKIVAFCAYTIAMKTIGPNRTDSKLRVLLNATPIHAKRALHTASYVDDIVVSLATQLTVDTVHENAMAGVLTVPDLGDHLWSRREHGVRYEEQTDDSDTDEDDDSDGQSTEPIGLQFADTPLTPLTGKRLLSDEASSARQRRQSAPEPMANADVGDDGTDFASRMKQAHTPSTTSPPRSRMTPMTPVTRNNRTPRTRSTSSPPPLLSGKKSALKPPTDDQPTDDQSPDDQPTDDQSPGVRLDVDGGTPGQPVPRQIDFATPRPKVRFRDECTRQGCNKDRYYENGTLHDYCGKTCAANDGVEGVSYYNPQANCRETATMVLFYEEACPFSQWSKHSFEENGVTYRTAEHYMMARKAALMDDQSTKQHIINARDPGTAKRLGRNISPFSQNLWDKHKLEIVREGNMLKFQQNEDIRRLLCATGQKTMVEASGKDLVWGVGLTADDPKIHDRGNWRGDNLLGEALEIVRTQLC